MRGRLPEPDELSVAETLELWVRAEARAECESDRADRLVDVIDRFNEAWSDGN